MAGFHRVKLFLARRHIAWAKRATSTPWTQQASLPPDRAIVNLERLKGANHAD